MTHTLIHHVYEQLRQRLMLDTWKEVPKALVCYCLRPMYTPVAIGSVIGYEHDRELVLKNYTACKEIIAEMNVKITYNLN